MLAAVIPYLRVKRHMLGAVSALPVPVGIQIVLAFPSRDLQDIPRDFLHWRLDPFA